MVRREFPPHLALLLCGGLILLADLLDILIPPQLGTAGSLAFVGIVYAIWFVPVRWLWWLVMVAILSRLLLGVTGQVQPFSVAFQTLGMLAIALLLHFRGRQRP